jgi:pimeloyl-ACP methyl ester carboxylesterase
MRHVDVGYARVGVHEWGDERAIPFVVVGSGAHVAQIATPLVAAGFRVLALAVAATFAGDAVDLVRDAIDELEVVRLVLMGGSLALAYAFRNPADVCALVHTGGAVDQQARDALADHDIPLLEAGTAPNGEQIAGWLVDQGI